MAFDAQTRPDPGVACSRFVSRSIPDFLAFIGKLIGRSTRVARRRGRASAGLPACHQRANFLKKFYPGKPDRVWDPGLAGLFQLGQFGRGFIRPVAHPAVGKVAALEEEFSLVVRATVQGEGFAALPHVIFLPVASDQILPRWLDCLVSRMHRRLAASEDTCE